MSARSAVSPLARRVARGMVGARTARWAPFSRLFAVGDLGRWSVDKDAAHLEATAQRIGVAVGPAPWARFASRQSVFLTSHFSLLDERWLDSTHRLGTAYLHGRPGTPGAPEFDESYSLLCRHPRRLSRVQVTHAEMHDLVLSAGVPPERIFRIPLGIDLENFPLRDEGRLAAARAALGIPPAAFTVGSFQKDGVGWGEGDEPKLVKGPDVLVAALSRLRSDVPALHVLLTGPARGYVRRELDRAGIPHTHVFARDRAELSRAYHALDVYLVASRQEGGPKSVLEAMASGIPVVSTRVGQAQEVVEHGRNGWLADVEDVERLAELAARVSEGVRESVLEAARVTAQAHALERLDGSWSPLLDGFVERSTDGGR